MSWPQGTIGPPGLLEYRWGSDAAPNTTTVRYLDHRVNVLSTADTFGKQLVQQNATLTKFRVGLFTALASSNLTITLMVNGVDSSFAVTINAGGTGGVATGTVSVVAGDLISVKVAQSAAEAGNIGLRAVCS